MEQNNRVEGDNIDEALKDFTAKMEEIIIESKLPLKYLKLRLQDILFSFYFKIRD